MENNIDHSVSISDHIGEIRNKIFIILIFFTTATLITHLFHTEIISFLLKPAGNQKLVFLSPLEPLLFIFKIDFIGGFILSIPIIVWSVLSFVNPAIPKQNRMMITSTCLASIILLFLGLAYSFFVMIPISLKFLISIKIPGIENSFSAEKYIEFFITQSIIITSIFQIPIIITGGTYLGLLKTNLMRRKRRYIYMIILIALAIITPTTDVFSLSIVFIPCLIIFEISLLGGKIIENHKNKN